jgi:hypothetical protein
MDWLRLHEACDLDDRARHFPASGTMTPREVAQAAAVSYSDRIWVLLRCVDRATRVDFARWCAAEAKRYAHPDAAADAAAYYHAAAAAAADADADADAAAYYADAAAYYADAAAAASAAAYYAARQRARDSQLAWLLAKI